MLNTKFWSNTTDHEPCRHLTQDLGLFSKFKRRVLCLAKRCISTYDEKTKEMDSFVKGLHKVKQV